VLDGMGLNGDERARVRAHAGLDIGARTPKEIALAILAEVVREIRVDGLMESATRPGDFSTVAPYPQATHTILPLSTTMTGGGTPREGGVGAGDDQADSPPRRAIDPVCGMTVLVDDDTAHAVVDGQDYWFCRVGCRDTFMAA
jgi:xanthine dehydrogenase accessory factor